MTEPVSNINRSQVVLEYLEGATSFFTGGIFGGGDYPPSDKKPSDGPMLVFKARPGEDDYSDVIEHISFQFKCYGHTSGDIAPEASAEAGEVALHAVLQNAHAPGILWARRETTGQPLREPDTDWPFVLVFYKIMLVIQIIGE